MESLLPPEDTRHRTCRAGNLGERLDDKIARHVETIFGARPRVRQRREIITHLFGRAAPYGRIVDVCADELTLDRQSALRRRRHASEGNARRGDAAPLDRDPERAEHGGDILIEAFADLVGLEKYRGWQFWHDQAAHEFAG